MRSFFNNLITNSSAFYMACFLFLIPFARFEELKANALTQTMSRFVPPIKYFENFVDKNKEYDQFKLHQCIAYHKRVAVFFPYQKSEAYQMLGFCYDRLGDFSRAKDAYQLAMEANSNYFWPYYNLGIYAFRSGQYKIAIQRFQQAIRSDIKQNMILMLQSKVLNDVRLSDRPDYDLLQSYLQARKVAYVFTLESLSRVEEYQTLVNMALMGIKEGFDDQEIFLFYAGQAFFFLKLYDRSVEFLQMALEKNPQNPDALYYLAQCMRLANKQDSYLTLSSLAQEYHQKLGSKIDVYLASRIKFF